MTVTSSAWPPRKPKLDARTADYVQFFTIDDLRRDWRATSGGADARTTLRDDITISRAELEMEIRWRVWWERVGYGVLLIGAVAAVIAAVEGAMPTGSLRYRGEFKAQAEGR